MYLYPETPPLCGNCEKYLPLAWCKKNEIFSTIYDGKLRKFKCPLCKQPFVLSQRMGWYFEAEPVLEFECSQDRTAPKYGDYISMKKRVDSDKSDDNE